MKDRRWHIGDVWAAGIGMLVIALAWSIRGNDAAGMLVILLPATYLIGRGNGAHR